MGAEPTQITNVINIQDSVISRSTIGTEGDADVKDSIVHKSKAGAIETHGLTKRFGELVAVDNLDLDVAEGEIFGLLGPNGAGKTTTISMLATLLGLDGGSASVAGFDVVRQPAKVREQIGIVFQDPSSDDQKRWMRKSRPPSAKWAAAR